MVSGTMWIVALLLAFSACGSQTRMSVERRKDLVRDEFRRWELLGDERLIDESYAADCVWHAPGGLEMKGHDGLKKLMVMLGTAFPDKRYTLHDIIVEGDKAVARWTLKATHKGEYMGVPATHKPVTMSGIYIIRFVEGEQAEWWLEADFLGLMNQIGATPPTGAAGE